MLTEETLREKAGEETYAQGRMLFRRALVREIRRTREEIVYWVSGEEKHQVHVGLSSVRCDCDARNLCAHAVAAMLTAMESGQMQEMEKYRAQQAVPALFEAVSAMLPESDSIRLVPALFLTKEGLRIGLKLGEERLYVVRHVPQFLQCREERKALLFGKGFEYNPQWMRFDEKQNALLDILAEYCENAAAAHFNGADARVLLLPPRTAARVLQALESLPFTLQIGEEKINLPGIAAHPLPLNFHLTGSPAKLNITAGLPGKCVPLTPDYRFVLCDQECLQIPQDQRALLSTLRKYSTGREAFFSFPPQDTPRVMSELLPFLLRVGTVTIDPKLDARFVRLPLLPRVYLDKEGGDVTARVSFVYGGIEIDPFMPETLPENELLLRDAAGERTVLDELAQDGFRVFRGRVYLTGNERIYDFVTDGANRLTKHAQVFFSKDFRRLTPRKPLFKGTMRLRGGQLQLELMDGDTPIEELLPLLEALRKKRRYFRFKEGTYLDLSDSNSWQPLVEAIAEAEENTGKESLGAYWAAYLTALIRENGLNVTLDEATTQAASLSYQAPEPPIDCLRPYQKRGYEWLLALHALGMGGILADDMGLGKTVQTLSALLSCAQHEKKRKPSLIVSPTSLTYNWLSECEKFTPGLSVLMLSGSQAARAEQIDALKGPDAPDLVITSYPLIRRDIALMKDIPFRFAVLDEAQQIKNVQSVGAHAVKQLTAETHIALTGTPMENHAGELWSLFDFVLPGYLPRYTEFLHRWGDGDNAADLRRRIRPFLMRRLRSDVLGELPERLESVMMAELPPEQRRVYDAALLQKRERVDQILKDRGLSRGRAEVLSAITELRQICCHPALCLPDYAGISGKMEMLMDVLPPAIAAGRRALVFSQFTSMLHLIEKRLQQEGIPYLYLDGETPAAKRIELCRRFNEGETNVFLISLKAGGTGLNLTGADLVIHYDPWWNPTAEEQATGRAHRIGQTKKVEVLRLVVHHSIEEQVLRMSDRKRRLFDQLITPGEEMPTRLTEKDILALFDAEDKT
ncbi:MAG: SNF2 helicase associated domain-containing protein [Clostridia bacterium]|nr:SNF2 helicase associated domain-containing protein [Clostridia bacterium]